MMGFMDLVFTFPHIRTIRNNTQQDPTENYMSCI